MSGSDHSRPIEAKTVVGDRDARLLTLDFFALAPRVLIFAHQEGAILAPQRPIDRAVVAAAGGRTGSTCAAFLTLILPGEVAAAAGWVS